MTEDDVVRHAAKVVLKQAGFRSARNRFVKSGDVMRACVGLQRSAYSRSYYINVYFDLLALNDDAARDAVDWQVNIRGERLLEAFGITVPHYTQLLDLQDESDTATKSIALTKLFEQLVQLIQGMLDSTDPEGAIRSLNGHGVGVWWKLRHFLETGVVLEGTAAPGSAAAADAELTAT